MKDLISMFDFMHCGKGKLCHLALTLFCLWGAQSGVIQNILMPCDFINEMSSRWSTVAKQCHLDQGLYICKGKLKLIK